MIWPLLSLLACAMSITSVAIFVVTTVRTRRQITALALSLKKEQRLSTQLREMLSATGVETIVTPTRDGYALSFKAHFPPPNVASALRAWRGPIGRA